MTNAQLNRDIKRLNNEIYRMSFEAETKYFEYTATEARKEFLRLYNADREFTAMNRQSILIMMRLNLKFQFVPLHQFGLSININK